MNGRKNSNKLDNNEIEWVDIKINKINKCLRAFGAAINIFTYEFCTYVCHILI